MPEYLAPGVFVEETSFRQKTIEGVSTSTTGFVGPTRFGPTTGEPPLLTSFTEFERIYGGIDRLELGDDGQVTNYVAHAVRAYFDEGGKRLYLARTFNELATVGAGQNQDGRARWTDPTTTVAVRARHPGNAGNFRVAIAFKRSDNVLANVDGQNVLRGVQPFDTVALVQSGAIQVFWVERTFDASTNTESHVLRSDDSPGQITLDTLDPANDEVRVLTVNVVVTPTGQFEDEVSWQDLSFHGEHKSSLLKVFAADPVRRSTELYAPLVMAYAESGLDAVRALIALDSSGGASPAESVETALLTQDPTAAALTAMFELTGGNDGDAPTPAEYRGDDNGTAGKTGLVALSDIEDISIVAAPGSTREGQAANAAVVTRHLITHCETMRYRVAVLDSRESLDLGEVQEQRAEIDTTRAALYYPWIRIYDPVTEDHIHVPPSGALSGIWARNDIDHGVHKSPANEVLRQALGFETWINKAQQEVLNPKGINCLRFFEGRGLRVWGARTASSDPEWKYLNVRRYFAFLERSIEKGTQWAVFENNGPVLWDNVRRTIEDFLFNEWKENHLLGRKPEQAFFVRCDETTMTQNDLDNGRLICLIGVAPLKPAEFVIFRIGQKTADAQ